MKSSASFIVGSLLAMALLSPAQAAVATANPLLSISSAAPTWLCRVTDRYTSKDVRVIARYAAEAQHKAVAAAGLRYGGTASCRRLY